jgi:cell wall-associated NlpC family hydrolase
MTALEVMLQREDVVKEAKTWIGTPHHHHARIKGAGIDCGLILAEVYRAAGVVSEDIDPGEYVHDWHLHKDEPIYLRTLEKYAAKIDGPPQPGDIALYRYGRQAAHGAIVIEWPVILHAYIPAGEVVLDDAEANAELKERFVGLWSPWAKKGGE